MVVIFVGARPKKRQSVSSSRRAFHIRFPSRPPRSHPSTTPSPKRITHPLFSPSETHKPTSARFIHEPNPESNAKAQKTSNPNERTHAPCRDPTTTSSRYHAYPSAYPPHGRRLLPPPPRGRPGWLFFVTEAASVSVRWERDFPRATSGVCRGRLVAFSTCSKHKVGLA